MNRKLVLQKLCIAANELDGHQFKKEVDAITVIMRRVAGMYDDISHEENWHQVDQSHKEPFDGEEENELDMQNNLPDERSQCELLIKWLKLKGIEITNKHIAYDKEFLSKLYQSVYSL